MELSHFGAKRSYTLRPFSLSWPRVYPYDQKYICPEDLGTEIERKARAGGNAVSGLSSIDKVSLLLLRGSGMIGIPGFSKRLFEALAKEKINVILITQSSSEYSICVAIDGVNVEQGQEAVDEEFAQ
jgi:aspartokinase/homoserine dehydrogenase 1